MNALEIAVYALVLTGNADPFTCRQEGETVTCSNGPAAALRGDGVIVFRDGVEVQKLQNGKLQFSNGITSYWGSAGWVQFSNGLSARRQSDGSFRFSNGMECTAQGADAARCLRRE
jgi:hypothetical protein